MNRLLRQHTKPTRPLTDKERLVVEQTAVRNLKRALAVRDQVIAAQNRRLLECECVPCQMVVADTIWSDEHG